MVGMWRKWRKAMVAEAQGTRLGLARSKAGSELGTRRGRVWIYP